ncbi:dihydroxyacetone kinase subunit L [Tabrizicola sp. TH137]|uniref:dihydroxyacetone kinase subunit DhaL n=1 Tax=Tabrizicola sp. TH137 TaxID=2067452 RepID=UPI000C7A5875|nr:dihydroxyacetone kinase subunit DhaL [Tabrizicola sp. TH137]PLL12742.1 dihydroxyacetone kinase subunit L [Tabrizicola sp. TH137]
MDNITNRQITDIFRLIALRLSEARVELGALDGAIGDADHGNSMAEGFAAVVRATSAMIDASPSELFMVAARSFHSEVGATTGPLYASAMMAAGRDLDGKTVLTASDIVSLLPSFARGIAERGKAQAGDKTMMDAWGPAARAAAEALKAGLPAQHCMARAERAAREGCDSTRAMVASVGRAARLGARSLGHVDPGAASAVIIIAALQEWLAGRDGTGAGDRV